MIWALIPASIRRALAWLAAGLVAIGGAWLAGRRNGAVRADLQAARANDKAHERMNNAEMGADLDDDSRRKRLRELADRLEQ
jgi:hypothetical protein